MGQAPSLAVMMNGKKPDVLGAPVQQMCTVKGLLPLVVMLAQLAQPLPKLVDQRPMPRQRKRYVQIAQPLQRAQKIGQRVWVAVGPAADVRRDLGEHGVATQHQPLIGAVEHQVLVAVPWRGDRLEPPRANLDRRARRQRCNFGPGRGHRAVLGHGLAHLLG